MLPIVSTVFVIGQKIAEKIKGASWCDMNFCGHYLIYIWYADCFWRGANSILWHLVVTALSFLGTLWTVESGIKFLYGQSMLVCLFAQQKSWTGCTITYLSITWGINFGSVYISNNSYTLMMRWLGHGRHDNV